MSRLTERAYAKLNLALHVRGRMADGYHRIETIFAFCEDGDELTAEPAGELTLGIGGPYAVELGSPENNLVMKAARELRSAGKIQAGAAIHLEKHLPVASGIGGGSADAAAALRLLTRLWELDDSLAAEIAPMLGADVPACLSSSSARGQGRGDVLDQVALGLGPAPVLLVNPGIGLSTSSVFGEWDGVDRGPLGDWRGGRNDLEGPAIGLAPEIADLLNWLRAQAGTTFVRMAGSGATCFALFDGVEARDGAARACPAHWWHLATRLR